MKVDALTDTGSPFTCLALKDLDNTRVPYSHMRGETVYLAGFAFTFVSIGGVVLSFRTDANTLYKVRLQSIGGLVPTKRDPETLKEIGELPSIVGNDFLEDQQMALHFDPSANNVYLETKP